VRYSLAIFDLDGTLADSFPWFLGVLNTVAREFRFREVAENDIEPLRHGSVHDILRKLDVPLWKVPRIAHRMRAQKRADMAHIPLCPGVSTMLRALADAGLTLALVSSDNEANARDMLGASNAALIAHFACGAALFGKAKKFKRVIRQAGVAPDVTIAIGDEIRDIEAARAAGITCAAVTWGYTAPEALRAQKPDVMFRRMEDIATTLTTGRGDS
jgi:phosphoglycolate phosphatase